MSNNDSANHTDLGERGIQTYHGGIILVSYIVSVIGAQTTLELLSKRTHFKGTYNWFLLSAAAFVMGAVSIWSMHFIGNNSMTVLIYNERHQLSYSAGYTFASLVVAIVCMFVAFIFVGVTEDAKVTRIGPSGIFAGLGIACMHYTGQFAIETFEIHYRAGYIVGAIIIACFAITLALYIFFKLREKWLNQWYKRLGCSILMAVAVCSMHYTGLKGTEFYLPNHDTSKDIPKPKLSTAALIGIISAIILSACVFLIGISIKASIHYLPIRNKQLKSKKLILNSVMFDSTGKILVKVDGTLPSTEIVDTFEVNEPFNSSHPIFMDLFNISVNKTVDSSTVNLSYDGGLEASIIKGYLDGCSHLKDELRLPSFGEQSILSDIVITTVNNQKRFFRKTKEIDTHEHSLTEMDDLLTQQTSNNVWSIENTQINEQQTNKRKNKRYHEDKESTYHKRLSTATINTLKKYVDGDKHVFLIRNAVSNQEVDSLLSHGFRFAETIFIAKTMAAKLNLPINHMRHHFSDMYHMTSAQSIMKEGKGFFAESAVFIGAFVLVDETNDMSNTHILIERDSQYSFPLVQLKQLSHLEPVQNDLLFQLQGHTLFDMTQLKKIVSRKKESAELAIPETSTNDMFISSLEMAAQQLISMVPDDLFRRSKLHPTILDLPPFSLTMGSCQLILFKLLRNTPQIVQTIQSNLLIPIKCIPLPLYRPICEFITDQAVKVYQSSNHFSMSLIQQRIYCQQTSSLDTKKRIESSGSSSDMIADSFNRNAFSLPPPPRAKHGSRLKLAKSLLNQTQMNCILQDTQSTFKQPVLPSDLETQDRFWWINSIVEELLQRK